MNRLRQHSWLRKTIVLLLAFVIVMTYMPAQAYAGEWRTGDKAYFRKQTLFTPMEKKSLSGAPPETP